MNFKVEEKDGKFVVMVETPIVKPFWKFWGPTTQWVKAKRKDGEFCEYDKPWHAQACIKFMSVKQS